MKAAARTSSGEAFGADSSVRRLHFGIVVTNQAMADITVSLALHVEADFADLDEALAGKRQADWSGAGRDVAGESGGAGASAEGQA